MAVVAELVEGFEDGLMSLFTTNGTTPTIETGTVHGGLRSAKFAPSGSVSNVVFGTIAGHRALSAFVYFDSLPSVDCVILHNAQQSGTDHRIGIGINAATGKWRLMERINNGTISYGSDGPTVVTGQWIQLHLGEHTTDASFHYITGWVDGTSLGTLSTPIATGGALGTIICGTASVFGSSNDTFTFYMDDILYHDTNGLPTQSEPWEEYRIERLLPNGEGTHSTPGSFTDDLGNSPPNSVFDRLDDATPSFSDADFVKQSTVGTGDYLEVNFENTTFTGGQEILGVMAIASRRNQSGFELSTLTTRIRDEEESANWDIYTGNFIQNGWGFLWGPVRNPSSTDWSPSSIDQLKGRTGFSSDVTPNPQCGYLALHVAGPVAPGDTGYWGILLD